MKEVKGCFAVFGVLAGVAAAMALPTENPFVTMDDPGRDFFRLIPQDGVQHLITEDAGHNAIWDMAVSPEGRVFFSACGESYLSVYARMYEYDFKSRKLVRHFDLEKRLALDPVGLRTSKIHTSMSFPGNHKMLFTTHTTSPSPRHPMWMPYEYFNHAFEGFKGSDLVLWDYETGETKGLGKFTMRDTIYGATYDKVNGDYFGISCLRGYGYVYNLHDGSIRELGQVTDSRSSRCFACSDGHIYGSTFTGAIFRYNTQKRDIEYMGVSATGLLRQAAEYKGILYFITGTCGVLGRGLELFAYDFRANKLKKIGTPVPQVHSLVKGVQPEYQAYGMAMDGEGRMWYSVQAVTPTVRFAGAKLFMWDFLRGKAPLDCGFLGTPVRTASLVADTKIVGDMMVCTDGNHTSDVEMPCGIFVIDLRKFVPALEKSVSERLFTHDYVNYLPYPADCFKWYPKDDFDAAFARYVKYDKEVVKYFDRFKEDNAFRISSEGAAGISFWERTGRENAAVKSIRWTANDRLSVWCGERTPKRVEAVVTANGRAHVDCIADAAVPAADALPELPKDVWLPVVPGRRYVATPSAAVRLADASFLVGTKDGLVARVFADGRVRAEGSAMTDGPVRAMALAPDGSVWGISAHDQGVGYVFRWTESGGLELKGLPPDVRAENGRNVHIYQPTAIAVSPDGKLVAVGGSDELSGVTVFPSVR